MTPTTNITKPKRLKALAETCLLHSPPEDAFDRYTRLCAAVLGVPLSMMVLVEVKQNFYKSHYASYPQLAPPAVGQTEQSFCQYVVLEQKAFIIENCHKDHRTSNLVPVKRRGITAYAGLPIRNPEGEVLGSFCAFDLQPRAWTAKEIEYLNDLRNGIESEIAMRLQLIRLDETSAKLQHHLQAVQQLFSDLEHEVRTPLNAVVNLSHSCSQLKLSEPAGEMIATVSHKAEQLSHLIENTLDLASITSKQLAIEATPASVLALIQTLKAKFTNIKQSNLTLSIHTDPQIPESLFFDSRRLLQLLELLLQLHLIYGRRSGNLSLQVQWSDPDLLRISLSSDSYRLSSEKCAEILARGTFKESTTNTPTNLINSLVDLLGGRLWTEQEGQKTTFQFRLKAAKATCPNKSLERFNKPFSILAIDDDPTNLLVLSQLARRMGHKVYTAKTGEKGLAMLSKEKYHLLLLDLRMPGMDGFEVARKARMLGCTLPIIAVTADASELAQDEAYASGMNGFLTKPIRQALLSETIDRFCNT